MVFVSRREKRLWFAAGLCVFLIYSSLYVARPAAELLREWNLLRIAVALAFVAAAGLIVWRLVAGGASWRVLGMAALVGVSYLVVLTVVPMMPEERLHFLQYGVVAALVYLALEERRRRIADLAVAQRDLLSRLPPLPTAVVITGIAGWVDEGIQAILPNRVYDVRDIAFNIAAALWCVVAVKLVTWARHHE